MIYTRYEKLNIIKLKTHMDTLPFDIICKALQMRPSNTIYCEADGKLYGIISSGDIDRAHSAKKNCIPINKKFTSLLPNKSMEARKIFMRSSKINAIPVVGKDCTLLGEYTRWDKFYLQAYGGGIVPPVHFKKVFLLHPCELFLEKQEIYRKMEALLVSLGVQSRSIAWNEVLDRISSADEILVTDREEYWAMHSVLVLSGFAYMFDKVRTYEDFMKSFYLSNLRKVSVPVFNLVFRDTEHSKIFSKKLENKVSRGIDINNRDVQKNFFCELYSPEYAKTVMYPPVSVTASTDGRLKDCESEFFNVAEGERRTSGQPKEYSKTIYFVGPCFVYGHYVEDKYTIESFLQKYINDGGHNIKVVNYGILQKEKELVRIKELPLKCGDIVIVYVYDINIPGIPEINLMNVLRNHDIEIGWVLDDMRHCNHKVNALYAEAIYDALGDALSEKTERLGEKIGESEETIKTVYIDRYFADFDFKQYGKVGAIVMNCNPFTYGHRYLIEQALKIVEFLILFVVEEDASLFSFTERFRMVCDGTRGLENVMAVPSGPFILSKTTFPEYFVKETDEDIVRNVEWDITCFAEKIAPHLNISCRFVGEEPEDAVTNEYNLAMKRILPTKGIEIIEIPRKEHSGRCISGSLARKCLEEADMKRLRELVPESTVEVLFTEWI